MMTSLLCVNTRRSKVFFFFVWPDLKHGVFTESITSDYLCFVPSGFTCDLDRSDGVFRKSDLHFEGVPQFVSSRALA